MSKTQLTKNIEKALCTYQPAKFEDFEFNYRRGQYMEFECPVTHSHIEDGLVDCVWLAEGFNNHRKVEYCKAAQLLQYSKGINKKWSEEVCYFDEKTLRDIDPKAFVPCDKECVYKREMKGKDEAVAIICFEIKVSVTDFHSKNGHNFIGNLNYYVMPYGLYTAVKDDIPEDIGCITYHYKDDAEIGKLRHTKSSKYVKEVDKDLYNSLMHTVLNRKDKEIYKTKRDARDALSQLTDKASSVVRELVERLQAYVEYPEEDCYKEGPFGCSNCSSIQIRCDKCVWGYYYQHKLKERYDGRKLLNEHYNSLL